MEGMEARIAAYKVRRAAHECNYASWTQESRKRPEPSLYDKLFLDPSLIKLKYRPGGKPPKAK